jgi:hypothetical protein
VKDINIAALKNLIRDVALATLATMIFALQLTGQLGIWPLVAGLVVVLVAWKYGRFQSLPTNAVLGAGFALGAPRGDQVWFTAITAAVVIGASLLEAGMRSEIRSRSGTAIRAVRLPGFHSVSHLDQTFTFDVTTIGLLLFGLAAVFQLPMVAIMVVILAGFGGALGVLGWGMWRWPPSRIEASYRKAVAEYAPRFLVYFSAPVDSEYQILMWLPIFEKVGLPYLVIIRERYMYDIVAEATSAPVVMCPTLASVDAVMESATSAVFYVNNSMKNSQGVRFGDKIHVQILHGESDKPPSYNPVTAMFDQIYVAGQGGVDRYAQHGVDIPADKFRIVGRPQVEKVQPATALITDQDAPLVLYAPTWQGFYDDTSLTSLPFAVGVVQALLDLGARVVFRPHPYSFKHAPSLRQINEVNQLLAKANAAGGEHLFGEKATSMGLFDTFNVVDALVTDVSSVSADFLFSGKPFAVIDVGDPASDPLVEYPMMRAGYLLRPKIENPLTTVEEMLRTDPMVETRRQLRTYYLGDLPTETYAEVFLDQVRQTVADGDARRQAL